MEGIDFVTNDKGERVAVQIDLRKHGELWEERESRDSGLNPPISMNRFNCSYPRIVGLDARQRSKERNLDKAYLLIYVSL